MADSDSQVWRRPLNTVSMSSLQIGMISAVRADGSSGMRASGSVSACLSPNSATLKPISAVMKPADSQPNSSAKRPVCRISTAVISPSVDGSSHTAVPLTSSTAHKKMLRRRSAARRQALSRSLGNLGTPGISANARPRSTPNQGRGGIEPRRSGGAEAARCCVSVSAMVVFCVFQWYCGVRCESGRWAAPDL